MTMGVTINSSYNGPVVVFSKGKPDFTHTAKWFWKYDYYDAIYVVSEGDDVSMYERRTKCKVVVAEGAHNLPTKRQWAVDNLTTPDRPWLRFFEDNIVEVTAVDSDFYHKQSLGDDVPRHCYHTRKMSPQDVLSCMNNDIALAQSSGVMFGGFSSNDNYKFRRRKYRNVAFVWTKMAYCHRDGPRWATYANEKDDYAHTSECLLRHGKVLVNNYLYPWSEQYEGRGGSRTIEQRAPDRMACVMELHIRYPGLWNNKDRPGRPKGTEIQLAFTNTHQVDKWRRWMLACEQVNRVHGVNAV